MFIGVSFAVVGDQVCAVAASDGSALSAPLLTSPKGEGLVEGLQSSEVLAFLYSLRIEHAKQKPIFVGFDFAVDLELLLRDLTPRQKDVFYGLIAEKEERVKDTPLYDKPEIEIDHAGFTLSYFAGKILRLALPKKGAMILYDIHSYFEGCDLFAAAGDYLQTSIPRLERDVLPLWQAGLTAQLVSRTVKQAEIIAALALRVEETIQPLAINPRGWYGPSAIAGACLNKWKARGQSRRLSEGNSPSELVRAVDVAYIGGRVEVIKLGQIEDVRTFDLNSAYAYAITFLSQFYAPLRFTRKYDPDCPFACWLVDYELPQQVSIGILPTRSPKGGIHFGSRGRGYFWQPEVDYLAQRYPDCFEIKAGFYTPEYKPVAFAGDVHKMYEYRLDLKEAGDKGEKIIKLALSNLYGKFAQNKGIAYYQCRAWAGWITSFVRRLMLEAVSGIEDKVVSFNQDAIHVTGVDCAAVTGNRLGQWKRDQYLSGFYVAPGIYDLKKDREGFGSKQASRGSNLPLDFARIADQLAQSQVSELSRQFFVGWQMARQNPIKYQEAYLSEVVETLDLIPSKMKARNYETIFNWRKENRDSAISRRFSGLMSSRYIPQEHQAALRLRLKDPGWA